MTAIAKGWRPWEAQIAQQEPKAKADKNEGFHHPVYEDEIDQRCYDCPLRDCYYASRPSTCPVLHPPLAAKKEATA